MANTVVVFLALAIFVAHCHMLKDKGPEHKRREKRSCYVCDDDGHGWPPPPPPPGFPPPPFFRKWSWNGSGRGGYGSQQGAFSAATSSTGTSAGGQESSDFGGQSAGYGGLSAANSHAQSGVSQNGAGFSGHSHNSYQSDSNKRIDGESDSTNGQRFEGQQQTQPKGFGAGAGAQSNFEGSLSSSRAYGSGSSENQQQQSQSANSGFGQWYGHRHHHGPARYQEVESLRDDNVQQTQLASNGQWQAGESVSKSNSEGFGVSKGSGPGAGSGQEALSGALNLASQGLETTRQTAPSGCSTCSKSGYAISNAKSDSGNAIALSIGR